MWMRSTSIAKLVKQFNPFGTLNRCYLSQIHNQTPILKNPNSIPSCRGETNDQQHSINNITDVTSNSQKGAYRGETNDEQHSRNITDVTSKSRKGDQFSRKDKIGYLLRTLMQLPDNKEAVYSTLDSWVAWEQNFPIGPLRKALITLEKEEEWHRIIQVIKWILSKGQGTTMGIYEQLIRALDKDNRPEEAHEVWVKKVGIDLHSVPWQLCNTIISVYYRNNMLERLVKVFKGLEAFDRKPPEKKIVQKVADAYELLGLVEEKERVLEKYRHLFIETRKESPKFKNREKSGREK